jgi:hypothetical protein
MKDLDVVDSQLARVLGFFPRVDTKVAGLFTVDSAILTIAALNVQAGDLRQWYVAVPGVLLLLGLLGSYAFLYRANFPQMGGGQGSLVYFAEIRKRTEGTYVAEFEAADADAYRTDMLGQVWRNSVILCEKYQAVSIAVRLTLATLLPFAVFLAMTAVEHSRFPVLKS